MKSLFNILLLVFSIYTNSQTKPSDSLKFINQNRIKNDIIKITQTQESRNYKNIKTLNVVADYIKSELTKISDSVAFQPYQVNGETYKNVIGSIGLEHRRTHYYWSTL